MDIGRALTFFTEEDRWVEKTAIGTGVLLVSSLLSVLLVGVLGFFIVMGYSIRLMRNVQQGRHPVLPEWDQWGDDLARGFKLFVAQFVWALPMIVVMIPVVLGSALTDGRSEAAAVLGSTLILCGACLSLLYGIFLAVIQPGIAIAFARNEEIRDALQLSKIWRWTQNHIGDVVIVAIVYIVGSLIISAVASIVGAVLCLIGLIVTLPLGQLIIYYFQYHLYGQLEPGILATSAATPYPSSDFDTSYSTGYDVGTGATDAGVEPSSDVSGTASTGGVTVSDESTTPGAPPIPPVDEPPVPPEQPTMGESEDEEDEDKP